MKYTDTLRHNLLTLVGTLIRTKKINTSTYVAATVLGIDFSILVTRVDSYIIAGDFWYEATAYLVVNGVRDTTVSIDLETIRW